MEYYILCTKWNYQTFSFNPPESCPSWWLRVSWHFRPTDTSTLCYFTLMWGHSLLATVCELAVMYRCFNTWIDVIHCCGWVMTQQISDWKVCVRVSQRHVCVHNYYCNNVYKFKSLKFKPLTFYLYLFIECLNASSTTAVPRCLHSFMVITFWPGSM